MNLKAALWPILFVAAPVVGVPLLFALMAAWLPIVDALVKICFKWGGSVAAWILQ